MVYGRVRIDVVAEAHLTHVKNAYSMRSSAARPFVVNDHLLEVFTIAKEDPQVFTNAELLKHLKWTFNP